MSEAGHGLTNGSQSLGVDQFLLKPLYLSQVVEKTNTTDNLAVPMQYGP